MNKKFNDKVIKGVENETCEKHGKSAQFEVTNDAIIISDCCCSEFYNYLANRIQKEYDNQFLKLL